MVDRQFVTNKFEEVSKLISGKNSSILDIGCHDGRMRMYIESSKYYGADINVSNIFNLNRLGVDATRMDLNKENLDIIPGKFDYILLLDVLEHILNPRKILHECRAKMCKNGKLIITLPNDYHILNKLRFLFNGRLTKDPFGPHGHLHYFSIKDGENELIKNQGFEILEKIIIPPIKPLFIPQLIKNILARTFPQSFARDILYLLEVK